MDKAERNCTAILSALNALRKMNAPTSSKRLAEWLAATLLPSGSPAKRRESEYA